MKTRQGFVSNSSSSSFIAAYYIADEDIKTPEYYKEQCEKSLSRSEIKKFALDFYEDVDDFSTFENSFWEKLCNDAIKGTGSGSKYKIPAGLEDLNDPEAYINGFPNGAVGKVINTGYDDFEMDADVLIRGIQSVIDKAPGNKNVIVSVGSRYN